MNLNHDPESWARVSPEAVMSGSQAQGINVLRMALQDIAKMAAEINRLNRMVRDRRIVSAPTRESQP